jgi:hypothetical protein
VLFHFDHDIVNVNKLTSDGHVFELVLWENLLETMVVLNQLGQCSLDKKKYWYQM